jgi:integral membrane sensor domain MASE1
VGSATRPLDTGLIRSTGASGLPWAALRHSRVLAFVAMAIAYGLLAQSAYGLFGALSIGVTFFPPAGLTLAAFLLAPRRLWVSIAAGIVVGELAVDLAQGQAVWWSLGWATANLVEPFVGAWVIRRLTPALSFSRRFVLAMLVGGLLIGPAIGAAIGAAVLARTGDLTWVDSFPDIWVGDGLGVLVVAPLVLVLARPDDFVYRRTRDIDAVVVTAVTALVAFVLVLIDELPLGYAAIVLLAIPAARYSAREVALAGVVVASVLTAATARGRGPWAALADGDPHAELVQQQAFLLVALGSAWLLKLEVVERVKAVADALDRSERYELEHDVAMTLQLAILPRHMPTLPDTSIAARYLQASESLEVGGDWYDVIVDEERRSVIVVIGDVAGHSLSAAAEMGNLASASRALAYAGHGPSELIDYLDVIASHAERPTMTTIACAQIDVDSRRIRYSVAGHPPPLVRSATGEVTRLDGAGSPPLAIGWGHPRAESVTTLAPGDSVLFYTDGLIEQRHVPIDVRLHELERTFAATDCTDVDAACDAFISRMLTASAREDDVALVCVSLC